MTKEIVDKYIDGGAKCCPYCGSDKIDAGHPEVSGIAVYVDVSCCETECKKSWTEEFSMSWISEVEECD